MCREYSSERYDTSKSNTAIGATVGAGNVSQYPSNFQPFLVGKYPRLWLEA